MQLSDALDLSGKVIPYYPELGKIFGFKESIFLAQLYFWSKTKTAKERDGWIYKSTTELEEELGFGYKEQILIRRHLKSVGVIYEDHDYQNHILYFKLDCQRMNDLMANGTQIDYQNPTKSSHEVVAQREGGSCPKVNHYMPKGKPLRPLHIYVQKSTTEDGNFLNSQKSKDNSLTEQVEQIFKEYPKAIGGKKAKDAILRALRSVSFSELLDRTKKFAEIWRGASPASLQYCPFPATWYGETRFLQDLALQGPFISPTSNKPSYGVYSAAKEKYARLREDIQYKYNEERMKIGEEMKACKKIIEAYESLNPVSA